VITPIKYKDVVKEYGEHGTSRLVSMRFPFKMFLSWDIETEIQSAAVHYSIKDELEEVFNDIKGYYTEDFIKENYLNEWGGCFNDRYSRSSNRWSVHSWGLAVDYLPSLGQFGVPARTPYQVVEAFLDHGFLWGGNWSYPDGMHFTSVIE